MNYLPTWIFRCNSCGHERMVDENWMEQIINEKGSGQDERPIQASLARLLPQLICEECGAKDVALNDGSSSGHRGVNKVTCPACGGSGLNDSCYKCLGTGWI